MNNLISDNGNRVSPQASPKRRNADLLALFFVSLVFLLCLVYVEYNPNFDLGTLFVGVILPLAFGSVVFGIRRDWLSLFAFLAFFWSLVDDKPVQFDSVLTWPEVTRFHPAGPHIFLEVVLHLATLGFLFLAVREALKGRTTTFGKAATIFVLAAITFVLSYAQNIPLDAIQNFATDDWYLLDVLEHIGALVFFYLTVRMARRNLETTAGLSPPDSRN